MPQPSQKLISLHLRFGGNVDARAYTIEDLHTGSNKILEQNAMKNLQRVTSLATTLESANDRKTSRRPKTSLPD